VVQNDLASHKLTWTEAVKLAPNRPLWTNLEAVGNVWRLLILSLSLVAGTMLSERCMQKTTTGGALDVHRRSTAAWCCDLNLKTTEAI